MGYRFFVGSTKAWKDMLTAITGAQHSISLGMYIFENNTDGYDFFAELERKAREGVRVVIVLDSVGSAGLENIAVDKLRIAGAEVRFFSHWFRRMHQKVLIIDEQVAFIGGVNIADRYAKWSDLHMRVSGRIVQNIISSFARLYEDCGGKNPELLAYTQKPRFLAHAKLWFVEHTPRNKKANTFRFHYLRAIRESNTEVTIITPYFLPHKWLIAVLHQALIRKVAVTIIVPKKCDLWGVDRANYYYLELMHKLGAQCYLTRTMNHAKAMLVDDRVGVVGSQNIDALSFDWNTEAGVFFSDEHMIRDLKTITEKWRSDAIPFHPEEHHSHWFVRLSANLLSYFQPIL